jgi:predicted Zn-dependent protease
VSIPGLFQVAKNDAQLAAMVAHEVAHVIARHGVERMSQEMLTHFAAAALGIGTSSAAYAQLGEQAMTLSTTLPYSRVQEAEADHIGVFYMAEAGYDPRDAIALWRNVESFLRELPPEFLSNHPAPGARIEALETLMPEALAVYRVHDGRTG